MQSERRPSPGGAASEAARWEKFAIEPAGPPSGSGLNDALLRHRTLLLAAERALLRQTGPARVLRRRTSHLLPHVQVAVTAAGKRANPLDAEETHSENPGRLRPCSLLVLIPPSLPHHLASTNP